MGSRLLFIVMMAFAVAGLVWGAGQAETEGEAGEEEVTLRLPIWPDIEDETLERINAFEEEHPNITFDFWRTDPQEYRQQIFVQLAGGAQIDLVNTQNNAVYAELASRGMLLPINEFIAEENYDTSYLGPFFEGTKINGKSYGLPAGSTAWLMFYNKDLFDEAGVAHPTDGMTWEDFYQKAEAVTSGSGRDKVWGAYFHTWPINWMGPAVQTGGSVVDQDLSPFQDALEFRKRLEDEGIAMPYFDSVSSNAHYSSVFYQGNTAMVPIGNWFIGMLWENEENYDFDWDIVQMPVPEGVRPGATWGMAGPLGIGANTEHPEAAWEYLKFVSSSDTSARILAREALLSFKQNDETRQLLLDRAEEEGRPENIDVLFDARIYPEYPAVTDVNYIVNTIFKEEAELYFADEKSSEAAIEEIQRRIGTELD